LATGEFSTKAAGGPYPVTVTGVKLGGADAGNYTVSQPTGVTASITAKNLTITGVTAADKQYDGNKTAILSFTGAALDGVVSPDVVTIDSSLATGEFSTKAAGGPYPVTVTGVKLGGADAGNYTVSQPTGVTASITQRPLTITATGVNKEYDGKTNATVTLSDNRVLGDVFTDSYTSASFADANAGDNKLVSVSGISISGTDAGNYTYNTTAVTHANITPKPATWTTADSSKHWNDSDPVPLTTGSGSGFLVADGVTATYSRAFGEDVGTYHITATLSASGLLTNYDITNSGATFTIEQRHTAIKYMGPTYGQSFDCVTLSARLTDITNGLPGTPLAGFAISLTIGSLPTVTGTTDSKGLATGIIACNLDGSTNPYTAKATFAGTANYAGPISDSTNFIVSPREVTPLPGSAIYTGSLYFWTTGTSSSTATLALSATITDASTDCSGDITKARLTFGIWNGTNFSAIPSATNLPVGPISPGNTSTGTATAIVQYNIGNADAAQLTIGIKVDGGRYRRFTAADAATISIFKPGSGTSVKISGVLGNAGSFGFLKGATGSSSDSENVSGIGGYVQYNKSGTNPQGSITVTVNSFNKPDGSVDNTVHTYQIKSNSIAELTFPASGLASFSAKATIQDLTTGDSVDAGATLQITMNQNLTTAGIVVLNRKGGLWFSSNWNGVRTTEKTLYGSIDIKPTVLGLVAVK
jgi:hypothetical protein